MDNKGNAAQISSHIQNSHHRKINRSKNIMIITVLIISLTGSTAAWQYHQSLPLDHSQQNTIASLVMMTANKNNITRHKVWAEIKARLNVRKKADIKRRDFNQVQEWLHESLM